MADIATSQIKDAGDAPVFVAASAADTAEVGNGRNTVVVYRNQEAAPIDVTVQAPGNTDYGQPWPDPKITIPAGGEAWIPLRKAYDQADGTGRAKLSVAPAPSGLAEVAVVRFG